MELKDGKKAVQAKNRAEWRKWLEKNHLKESSVWLILFHKKSPFQSIKIDEAMEEALCFGWIDSKAKNRRTYHIPPLSFNLQPASASALALAFSLELL